MRKTMSLKQLTANRRNAQKSTGPRTVNGREVSKMNAIKHGILSKQVLVRGSNIKESNRELQALHQRFWEELNPVGAVEEMLVDQIVTAHWRLRRTLTAESGEIASSVDKVAGKRDRGRHPTLQWMEWERLGDPIWYMQDSALGNGVLESWLQGVRKAVEKEGELTEAAIHALVEGFGGKPNSLTRELDKLRLKLQENPERLEASALLERNKEQALAFLDQKLRLVTWGQAECEERDRSAKEASQAAAVLPSMDVLEKIMRYETKLERQMFRAMAQLERLQRMRRGETVPPPVSVAVA